jgi:hypothetical protein
MATYLYGFTRPGAVLPAGLPGIEEHAPVRIDELAGLAAVISEVSVTPFESDGPSDPEWLIPRALRHEHVIESVHELAPVLPVRFGALFSDFQALELWALTHRPVIDRFLDHVVGKEEWSIKLLFDATKSLEFLGSTSSEWAARIAALHSISPGARYFQEKRLRQAAHAQGILAARQVASRIRASLASVAEERLLACRACEQPGTEMVLNAAYLVKLDDVSRFIELARANAPEASPLTLELNGPWPASHFCPEFSENAS